MILSHRSRLIIGLAALFLVWVCSYRLSPVDSQSTQLQTIVVAPGDGISDIAANLAAHSLIRSQRLMVLYALFTGSAHQLKPGVYQFSQALSGPKIIQKLVIGPLDIPILIVEGASIADIDATLTAAGVLTGGELIALTPQMLSSEYPFLAKVTSFEGFFFPDTYRFRSGVSALDIARRFLDTFSAKMVPLLRQGNGEALRTDWYQKLILASLLEREVPSAKDRRLVAGIFVRRLNIGMALQIDATVTYAKCKSFAQCPPLTRNDFKLSSPVNTYLHPGLPPHPIANPGTEALEAALYPESSPYLYYLSDPATGHTVFAATLEEHNDNRARYLHL